VRALIIADVHGNWEALQAVLQEPHDLLIFLGDAVDFGPEPGPCIDELRTRVTYGVRGNHDHGTAFGVSCRSFGAWQAWDEATHVHTLRLIEESQRAFLRALPLHHRVEIGGTRFYLTHASPSDSLYRYLPADASEDALAHEVSLIDAEVLLVGHTHVPMARQVGRTMIVNPGSVGMPRDGGPGARYAVWEDGRLDLRTAAYDVEAAVRSLSGLSLPPAVFQGITDLLRGKAPSR
jgi:putative phosphoesterase